MRVVLIAASLLLASLAAGEPQRPGTTLPRDAIEGYWTARATGQANPFRQAFAPDARIIAVTPGATTQLDRSALAKKLGPPAADEYRTVRTVERLDVSGRAASAVLQELRPRLHLTEHLSLVERGGAWHIVSDVSDAEPRDAHEEGMQSVLGEWSRLVEPRRIIGNIFYVGTKLISSFLITTPNGHILLDTGHAQMLPTVEANIQKLGFKVQDIELLLNSHAHFDHCGGFAELKRETGAKVVASKLDGELMAHGGRGDFFWGDDLAYTPVAPDRIVDEGDKVELGGVTLTAHLTPGHTKGCTSWSTQAREGGKAYDVLFLCGLTVSPYKLTNNPQYPHIVEDARASLRKLRAMHADVLLASHGFYFDYESKAAKQDAGGPNPFVDPGELARHLTEMEKDLEGALQKQERQR